jgi:cytochrome c-type biogenesis protein CcmH
MLMCLAVAASAQSLDEKAKELEGKLIAPCCWSQPVSQHYSQAADEIRAGIRQMLSEGKTSQQILDYYVSVYGERILASPRARGFNLMAYVLPYLSLGLGMLAVIVVLKKLRMRASAAETNAAQVAPPDSKYSARLEQELRDLE